jgi:hypothetical protein
MSELHQLEQQLQELSHSTEALTLIRAFAERLKNTRSRQQIFNMPGALLSISPIDHADALARGLIPAEEDAFVVLQGDVIATEAAYHMGQRLVGMRFLVANSTCDLVPGRRDFTALLPLLPIYPGETPSAQQETKGLLAELLRFTSTRRMYLPPLPGDLENGIVGNTVEFDRIAQARQEDVLFAERIASLSLVGWRIFGSHLRGVLTRAGESEVALRRAFTESS